MSLISKILNTPVIKDILKFDFDNMINKFTVDDTVVFFIEFHDCS
jgi:hypothetical protein